MSLANTIPIEQVPKTYEQLDQGTVFNRTKENFSHKVDGKPISIKSNGSITLSLGYAVIMAEHLAKKMVAVEHEKFLKETLADEKLPDATKEKLLTSGIPKYNRRVEGFVKKILKIKKNVDLGTEEKEDEQDA